MNNDLIRRSDVLDFLNTKLGACLIGDPEADYVMSIWEFVEKLPAVDAVELPVKPGTDLWWVDEDTEDLDIKCDKGAVKGVAVMADGTFKLVESLHMPHSQLPNCEYGITEINGDTSLLSEDLAREYRARLLNHDVPEEEPNTGCIRCDMPVISKVCTFGLMTHKNELGEDEIYCQLHSRWMNVTLGDCLGHCEKELPLN